MSPADSGHRAGTDGETLPRPAEDNGRHRSTDGRTAVATATSAARSRARERADRASRTADVLDRLDEATEQERAALLDELVEVNLDVARSIAKRYRHRGVSEEDLEQVACLALVRVARSYDHSAGHDFMSYAVPSIRGEVRRYFRDLGWMVRPPRREQEMQRRISSSETGLGGDLGQS